MPQHTIITVTRREDGRETSRTGELRSSQPHKARAEQTHNEHKRKLKERSARQYKPLSNSKRQKAFGIHMLGTGCSWSAAAAKFRPLPFQCRELDTARLRDVFFLCGSNKQEPHIGKDKQNHTTGVKSKQKKAHTHTYARRHAHTHTHTHAHIHVHVRAHTNTQANTHNYMRKHI